MSKIKSNDKVDRKVDGKRKITVTVNGDVYDLLERAAIAMNSMGWCGNDNTIETVLDEFVVNCQNESLIEYIANAIDTNTDIRRVDKYRRDDLIQAFSEVTRALSK